jgi:hypothetical protein
MRKAESVCRMGTLLGRNETHWRCSPLDAMSGRTKEMWEGKELGDEDGDGVVALY